MQKLPRFPEFKAVDLDCKHCIDRYLKKYPPSICEFAFSNMFVWKPYDFPKVTTINNNLCVLLEPFNQPAFFYAPIGDHKIRDTIDKMLSFTPLVSRVPEYIAEKFKNDPQYRVEQVRDHFDYVYLAKDLIELEGKKYDGKRNHIRRFKKNHSYEYRRLQPNDFDACLKVFDHWAKGKTLIKVSGIVQRSVLETTFANFEALGLAGGGIFIEGKLQAFSVGTKLNPQTAVIHFETANPDFKGLSQVINQEFVRHEWSKCQFIDREQDLGIPGLRKAKLSYHPHHLVNKYTISR